MRSEKEMINMLLDVAKKDERIRAVYMGGSRVNQNVQKDIFQDYDVVFMVNETISFIHNPKWIDVFGERLYMQKPDLVDSWRNEKTDFTNHYGYLMQFADGNRLDLQIQTKEVCIKELTEDAMNVVLLDKDYVLTKTSTVSDKQYWVKRPTEKTFQACCNQFWWLLNNVAKGLWREEVVYVMDMLNVWIRPEVLTMLSWYVGIDTNFACSVGKSGKYLPKYLSVELWDRYLQTYSTSSIDAIWKSVLLLCDIFEEVSTGVSDSCNFIYPIATARNSRHFLEKVSRLDKTATKIL